MGSRRKSSAGTRATAARGSVRLGITQRDVARVAGVSQAAVSRVIVGTGYVSSDVRSRIEKAATKLRYQPDALARVLTTGRSNIVAIVVANITNPFYPYALDALTGELQSRGLQALLFNAARGQSVDDLIPTVLQYRVRGIIITTASLSSKAAALCADKDIGVVMFNRFPRTGGVHTVSCDNLEGGRMAADRLLDAGCSRLAYIGGSPSSSTSEERQRGFVDRIRSRGLEPVVVGGGSFTYDCGMEAIGHLESARIDGIFCADDVIAFGAIDALRFRYAMRVPEDVSVIGFDDIPAAAWAPYDLTTIRQPIEDMVRVTMTLIDAPGGVSPEIKHLPGELIERSTVRKT